MEELKAVMDALSGLGNEAKAAFVAYLLYRTFTFVVGMSVIVTALMFARGIIGRVIGAVSFAGRAASMMNKSYDNFYRRDEAEALDVLRKHFGGKNL